MPKLEDTLRISNVLLDIAAVIDLVPLTFRETFMAPAVVQVIGLTPLTFRGIEIDPVAVSVIALVPAIG